MVPLEKAARQAGAGAPAGRFSWPAAAKQGQNAPAIPLFTPVGAVGRRSQLEQGPAGAVGRRSLLEQGPVGAVDKSNRRRCSRWTIFLASGSKTRGKCSRYPTFHASGSSRQKEPAGAGARARARATAKARATAGRCSRWTIILASGSKKGEKCSRYPTFHASGSSGQCAGAAGSSSAPKRFGS